LYSTTKLIATRAHRDPLPRLRAGLVAIMSILALAACGSAASSPSVSAAGPAASEAGSPVGSAGSVAPGASAAPVGSRALVPLTVGLGYIPSVQFAQFYLAQQAGYYRDAGLDVTFQNKIDQDLVPLVGQGSVDVGIADGTSVIPAVSQGIPIHYIATVYATFPNIVFAKTGAGIKTAADLKGKRIGTPCRCGSNWLMLEALLKSAGLTTSDVQVIEYPNFSQGAAVARDAVDAATGYANNEPLQLAKQGISTSILHVDPVVALPGPGLITSTKALAAKRDALQAFVSATLRAMKDIVADPSKGLDAAITAVPELASQRDVQRQILDATIASWQSPYTNAHGLGAIDPNGWAATLSFMETLPGKPLASPVTVDQLIDPSLLPK